MNKFLWMALFVSLIASLSIQNVHHLAKFVTSIHAIGNTNSTIVFRTASPSAYKSLNHATVQTTTQNYRDEHGVTNQTRPLSLNEHSVGFPHTRFTHHVETLVERINSSEIPDCDIYCQIKLQQPFSPPSSIYCRGKERLKWQEMIQGIFDSALPRSKEYNSVQQKQLPAEQKHAYQRILPSNVSLGISSGDWADPRLHGYGCLANSGLRGNYSFSITNFQDIMRLVKLSEEHSDVSFDYADTYEYVPWENRSTVPIWRGTAWLELQRQLSLYGKERNTTESTLEQALQLEAPKRRLKAVVFSKDHPDLLDARISSDNGFLKDPAWAENATNGLDRLLPLHAIPKNDYYTKYQVALVLGGIGAAFRTSVHMSTGTAIVLQDFYREEWFVEYMTPFVHYVPLAADLSNISETMHWIKDNPDEVKKIGMRGRQFYLDNLSLHATREHIYELLYRLSLKQAKNSSNTIE